MAEIHESGSGSGEVVDYDDRTGHGHIRHDRPRPKKTRIYFDRRSLQHAGTQLRVGMRVLFKVDYAKAPPIARDLRLEPSMTEELAKLPGVVTGRVVDINEEKRYGFIQVSPIVRAWFPFTAITAPNHLASEGDRVSCNITQARGGRLQAKFVQILEPFEPATDSGQNTPRQFDVPDETFVDQAATGKIVHFDNAGLGFIDADDGNTLLFGLPEVVDERLRETLGDPSRPVALPVVFSKVSSPGRKYDRAVNVRSQQTPQEWVRQAEEMKAANRLREALLRVDFALRLDPHNRIGLFLKKEVIKQLVTTEGFPKGEGPYALAKRAETVEKDVAKAELWYRVAIRENDSRGSAIKDLSWLLYRQRKTDEAVELLKHDRLTAIEQESFDNKLTMLREHSDQFEQVISILPSLVNQVLPRTKPRILKRLAFAYLHLQQFSEAIKTLGEALQTNPADTGAQRLLRKAQVAQAGRTSGQAEKVLESLENEEEFASPLSPLAESIVRTILERGLVKGIDASQIASGNLSKFHAMAVVQIAQKFGTDKPQDCAEYYLSAAAIIKRCGADDYNRRFQDYLRQGFASMGAAILLAQANPEVARTFYAEAISLTRKNSAVVCTFDKKAMRPNVEDELAWHPFIWFVRSFGTAELQKSLSKSVHPSEILEAVSQDLAHQTGDVTGLWIGLFRLAGRNAIGFRMFWLAVKDSDSLRNLLSKFLVAQGCDMSVDLQHSFDQYRNLVAIEQNCIESQFAAFCQGSLTALVIESLIQNLGQLENADFSELERQRLGIVRQTASDSLAFCQTDDFDVARNHYFRVQAIAEKFITDVEAYPTAISFESFLPLVKHLQSLVEESYAERTRPSLTQIKVELAPHDYVLSADNAIPHQVQISNRAGDRREHKLEQDNSPTESEIGNGPGKKLPEKPQKEPGTTKLAGPFQLDWYEKELKGTNGSTVRIPSKYLYVLEAMLEIVSKRPMVVKRKLGYEVVGKLYLKGVFQDNPQWKKGEVARVKKATKADREEVYMKERAQQFKRSFAVWLRKWNIPIKEVVVCDRGAGIYRLGEMWHERPVMNHSEATMHRATPETLDSFAGPATETTDDPEGDNSDMED
jgi:tetratricopeptide (TPR) repeat protein/cold shock CspA family protein